VNTQVLYDIVMKINDGEIDYDIAIKTLISNVKGARELNAMHVMAVLTLTGNCVNRDFLRRATLTEPCKKQGVKSLFPNNDISSSQMKRALLGVVRRLDLSEFIVENLLCESVRKKDGFDTFHPSQSITYLDETTNNILCWSGGKTTSRTEEDDRRVLAELPDEDGIVPLFPWWKATSGIVEIHAWYVKLCRKVLSVKPHSLVIRPHMNAPKPESDEEVWKRYIKKHKLVDIPQKRKRKRKGEIVKH